MSDREQRKQARHTDVMSDYENDQKVLSLDKCEIYDFITEEIHKVTYYVWYIDNKGYAHAFDNYEDARKYYFECRKHRLNK